MSYCCCCPRCCRRSSCCRCCSSCNCRCGICCFCCCIRNLCCCRCILCYCLSSSCCSMCYNFFDYIGNSGSCVFQVFNQFFAFLLHKHCSDCRSSRTSYNRDNFNIFSYQLHSRLCCRKKSLQHWSCNLILEGSSKYFPLI